MCVRGSNIIKPLIQMDVIHVYMVDTMCHILISTMVAMVDRSVYMHESYTNARAAMSAQCVVMVKCNISPLHVRAHGYARLSDSQKVQVLVRLSTTPITVYRVCTIAHRAGGNLH